MGARRGIDLLDVLPQTSSVALRVPDAIIEKIGILTVVDLRYTTSGEFFLHEGVLQSAAEALDLDTSAWVLRIPGLTHDLPFRLAIRRLLNDGVGKGLLWLVGLVRSKRPTAKPRLPTAP